jgi:hypothetical protein
MNPFSRLFRKAVLEGRRCAGCRKRLTISATPTLFERNLCRVCSLAYCDECALKLRKSELWGGFVVKNWLYAHPKFGRGISEFSSKVFVCNCGGPVTGEFNEIVYGDSKVPVSSTEMMTIIRALGTR